MVRSLTNVTVEVIASSARKVQWFAVLPLLTLFVVIVPNLWSQQTAVASGEVVDRVQVLARSNDGLLAVLNARQVLHHVRKHGSGGKRSKALDPKLDVSRIGDRKVDGGLNFYSMEREQELGRELAREIEQESTVVTDPVITDYV